MRIKTLVLTAGMAALLAACGGGGGGGGTASTSGVSLSGTAAIGAPLANAQLTLRGANGVVRETTANAQGEFVFSDISGLTAPAILRATGSAGGQDRVLFSVTTTIPATPGSSAVTNVTPLTNAVLTKALGAAPTLQSTVDTTTLNTARTQVATALASVLQALGTANADPFTTPFTANGQGLDKLLDLVAFDIVPGSQTIQIVDKGDPSNTISVSLSGAVATFTPPVAADLDTSGIASLINRFNQIGSIRSGRDFGPIVDENFLDFGEDRQSLLSDLNGSSDTLSITSWAIDGCRNLGENDVCDIVGTVNSNNIPVEALWLPVVKSGSEWKLFGNQIQTSFNFRPTFSVERFSGSQQNFSGFSLAVDVDQLANTTATSAKLFLSSCT